MEEPPHVIGIGPGSLGSESMTVSSLLAQPIVCTHIICATLLFFLDLA